MDAAKIKRDLAWLQRYPHFDQRPASIVEFLGPGYLDIESRIRPGIRESLIDIFGEESNGERIAKYRWGMYTGGIGIGKTTVASIILPYMVHWVLCLRDPQGYFNLLPGSRIAFMQMSTSAKQVIDVAFGDIFARIKHADWFVNNYPYDTKYTKVIKFAKDVWIIPGDSTETSFEGYNILGGILEEADSHKQTKDKDYADVGYDTINARIDSRFQDRGFLLVIGQMKKGDGFANRKYNEFLNEPHAYTKRMTIWESLGWEKFLRPNGERDSFLYDTKRKSIIPTGAAALITNSNMLEIPNVYKKNFETNPEKALRDLAGIPPATEDPFISLTDKIDDCIDRWNERNPDVGSPVTDSPTRPKLEHWFTCRDSLKRAMHIDLAVSGDGDALGLAMGHVSAVKEIDGELKPYIIIDMMYRVKAAPGTEILLQDIRHLIYALRDDRKFKIRDVTMDGFQSTDTMQQLKRRRFRAEYLSVDRNKNPYEDLREAIYEGRLEFPEYYTYVASGATERVQIAVKELTELTDTGKKIDHPPNGSKDLADALAGVVYTLMGARSYSRGVTPAQMDSHEIDVRESYSKDSDDWGSGFSHPALRGTGGMTAPLPPSGSSAIGILGLGSGTGRRR
ncbi:hypothetical protein AB0F25_30465 [Streptomyces wedmorensis]|uniref:hypothetical protein n=1 Tax=Streptomyces wedmorensis TaxID=43759 RepID=UPI0034206FC1